MNTNKIFIIAEAGVNHNGSLKLAKKLVDIAKSSGADAVKFQTWKKGELTGEFTKNVGYIKKNQKFKLKRSLLSDQLQLSFNDFIILKNYCLKKNILFLTTPDGFESLKFVSNVLKVKYLKIGSTELNHSKFLIEAAKTNIPLIVSTGMSSFIEIKKAVKLLKKYSNNFTILHCTSEYPVNPKNANLLSVKFLSDKLKVNIGFSDHTMGNTAAVMAVAQGAMIIEKHITIDNKLDGPDHKMSLNAKNFKNFVNELRLAEIMLGSYSKEPTNVELKSLPNIRRGAVAAKNIPKNTIITKEMIVAKRPFYEIEPDQIPRLVGLKLKINLIKDQPLKWNYFFKKYNDN